MNECTLVNSMDFPTCSNPAFFKILLDDANPNLKQFLEEGLPENPVLERKFGGKWNVGIHKIGEKFCFVNGWLDFMRDIESEVGDFIVFRPICKSTFKVTFFGPNACAKDLSFATTIHCKCGCNCSEPGISYGDVKNVIKTEEDYDDLEDELKIEDEEEDDEDEDDDMDEDNIDNYDKEEMDEEDDDHDMKENKVQSFDWKEEFKVERFDWNEECSNSRFIKVLTKSHCVGMILPNNFVKETGLDRKEKIVIRKNEMKKWSVRIRTWAYGRYYLGGGWRSFLKQNKLMDGDTCSFKYSRGEEDATTNFIDFEIVDKVARGRELSMLDRSISP